MYLRKKFRKWLVVFYVKKVFQTGGMNSNLPNGNHIPFFDFDHCNLREVETILLEVMETYKLSDVYIWNTGRPDSFNAISLTQRSFRECLLMAFSSPNIDLNFIRFAIWRGHFTLRILPKNERKPSLVSIIKSEIPADTSTKDIVSFTKYETSSG